MKLTSKEMAILSVFLSIAIIVAGLFLFVLPEYESIEPNKRTLQSAYDERDQVYASLGREATIDQEIRNAIDQANTIALSFYDDMTAQEADVIIREILDETKLSTTSLSIGSFTTYTLTVTDYVSTVVTYPLKDYSGYRDETINGSDYPISYDEEGNIIIPEIYLKTYGEEQALTEYLTALLSTQSQTVGAITANFTVSGARGDFLNFLNYVAGLEKATYISSTTVAYTGTVSTGTNTNTNTNTNTDADTDSEGDSAEGEAGAPVVTTGPAASSVEQSLNNNAEITAPITMTFYCVKPMLPQETTEAETEPEPESEPAE